MLNSFPVSFLMSTALGFLSGLGIGGGSLLMLWLTAAVNMPVREARIINLLFFLPCALISSFFRWKQGYLHFSRIFPAAISGCICGGLCTFWSAYVNMTLLKKCLGALLLLAGLRECFWTKKK